MPTSGSQNHIIKYSRENGFPFRNHHIDRMLKFYRIEYGSIRCWSIAGRATLKNTCPKSIFFIIDGCCFWDFYIYHSMKCIWYFLNLFYVFLFVFIFPLWFIVINDKVKQTSSTERFITFIKTFDFVFFFGSWIILGTNICFSIYFQMKFAKFSFQIISKLDTIIIHPLLRDLPCSSGLLLYFEE